MAKKFGGKYSPDGGMGGDVPRQAVVDDRVVDAAGARANILFVPAIVLVAMSFGDGPVNLALGAVCCWRADIGRMVAARRIARDRRL